MQDGYQGKRPSDARPFPEGWFRLVWRWGEMLGWPMMHWFHGVRVHGSRTHPPGKRNLNRSLFSRRCFGTWTAEGVLLIRVSRREETRFRLLTHPCPSELEGLSTAFR